MSAEAPKGHEDPARIVQILSQTVAGATATSEDSASSSSPTVVEGDHLNTDERDQGQWESRYPTRAQFHIRLDATYVAIVLFVTLGAILLTWRGTTFQFFASDCPACDKTAFDRYAFFYLGGQLGGTLFGIKYLYNVVARGWWNIDRRLWRLFSPFLSGGLALAIGALVDSGVLGLATKTTTGASYFSLGFITGYFADSALRKMKEVADTVFGSPEGHGSHSAKSR